MESEDLVRRYIEAVAANDFETMNTFRPPDWHEASYFAAPFEVPAWRASLTVPIGPERR